MSVSATLPPAPVPIDATAATRERLLDAAEAMFARDGYAATSVRALTAAAGSNLAAVNYHFGGKHNLYRDVLLRRLGTMRRQRLAALEQAAGDGQSLIATLRGFAEAFLAPLGEQPPEARPLRLIMREMVDPQLPREVFASELVRPVQRALTAAIAGAAPTLGSRTVQLCVQSFIAQLVHVLLAQQLAAASGGDHLDANARAEMVDHVVRFTPAAIDRLQETTS